MSKNLREEKTDEKENEEEIKYSYKKDKGGEGGGGGGGGGELKLCGRLRDFETHHSSLKMQ